MHPESPFQAESALLRDYRTAPLKSNACTFYLTSNFPTFPPITLSISSPLASLMSLMYSTLSTLAAEGPFDKNARLSSQFPLSDLGCTEWTYNSSIFGVGPVAAPSTLSSGLLQTHPLSPSLFPLAVSSYPSILPVSSPSTYLSISSSLLPLPHLEWTYSF